MSATTEPRVMLSIERDPLPPEDVVRTATWQPRSKSSDERVAFILDEFLASLGARATPAAYRQAFDALHEVVAEARTRAAARMLREALFRLSPNAPAAAALRRVLLGEDNSLEDEASLAGVSRQAIHKAEQKLRRTFRLPPR